MTVNKGTVQEFVTAVLFGVLAAGLILSGTLGINALTLLVFLLAVIFILRLVGATIASLIVALVGWLLGFLLVLLVRELDPASLSAVQLLLVLAVMLMMKV